MAEEISLKSSPQPVLPTQVQSTSSSVQASKDSLSISSTQVLPSRVPDLKVGDSLQFVVRSVNNANGLGVLYLFGSLIEAKLPKDVGVGDRVRAEILKQESQVILKIQEVIKKGDTQEFTKGVSSNLPLVFNSLSAITQITKKVEDLLIRINPYLPSAVDENQITSNNVTFPEFNLNKTNSTVFNDLLLKLKNILPNEEAIGNSSKLTKLLKQSFSGELSNSISVLSKDLSNLINQSIGSKEDRFLFLLKEKIQELIYSIKNDPRNSAQQLSKLIFALSTEIENQSPETKNKGQHYSDFLKVTLAKLKNLPEQKIENKAQNTLEEIKKGVDQRLENSALISQMKNNLSDENINQIKSFHQVVEQMLVTQEIINSLEPIMQSLREPEFVLFPFLFQGMFGFGELVVDPDANRNKDHRQEDNDDKKENEKSKTKNNQLIHFQGQIPLPSLGVTSFEAFYSKDKIDINFTLDHEAKVDFLTEKAETFKLELGQLIRGEVNIQSRKFEVNQLTQEEIKKAGTKFSTLPIVVI